jgi:hypothetical protein
MGIEMPAIEGVATGDGAVVVMLLGWFSFVIGIGDGFMLFEHFISMGTETGGNETNEYVG